MSQNKLKYASCTRPFSPPFEKKTGNIPANRTTDALLIKSILSCKTSPYWEYKCNMEHKWTKRIIINNDWNFHSHGRAWMNLFSARASPHTSTKKHYKATPWQPLILHFLSFFPSPVYFNHCIYQHLSGSFYLGRKQESNYDVLSEKLKSILNIAGSVTEPKNVQFLFDSEVHPFIWETLQTIQAYWILKYCVTLCQMFGKMADYNKLKGELALWKRHE